jgi:hypothetical protein
MRGAIDRQNLVLMIQEPEIHRPAWQVIIVVSIINGDSLSISRVMGKIVRLGKHFQSLLRNQIN